MQTTKQGKPYEKAIEKRNFEKKELNYLHSLLSCTINEETKGGEKVELQSDCSLKSVMVASPGIEPGSGASETLILSIVLRGLKKLQPITWYK